MAWLSVHAWNKLTPWLALTSSRTADGWILQDTSGLPYEFQEQLPSTQQEEIFHKFQLQKQFSLFHSKFPQMLYQDTGKHQITNYFQLHMPWPRNHIWIENCMTWKQYLNTGSVQYWACNHI